MSLDLERHLVFYGAYHHNAVNVAIHMTCVPIILFTGFWVAINSGDLVSLPSWLEIPHLPPNLGTAAALLYGGLYVLLEPVAGTAAALLCLAAAAFGNYAFVHYDAHTFTVASAAAHVVCWLLQFAGHGFFEGRSPALLDNLFQAIFMAPLFVWLEMLFACGYRPGLKARVEKQVLVEVAKFQATKASKKAANGKAE